MHTGCPLLEACKNCQYCKEGKEYLCESSIILGESLKGGYTEYITVVEDFATKVPENMEAEQPTAYKLAI